jgi:Sulfatase-modifying factor enzyme 1/TIR domain
MGGSIFISYRRETDSGFAGRLYDRLEDSFGRERVFIDVDSIAPGEDFVAVLESRVAECDVLLALIGRGWLTATDPAGRRRLDNPEDFVRIEIAAALAQGKRVIPVLSDNASMPRAEELPEDINHLARRQAIRIRHDRFQADAKHLIGTLEKGLADAEAVRQAEAGQVKEEESRKVEEEVRRAPVGILLAAEPSFTHECYVSYAWDDDTSGGKERLAIVERLCNEAEVRGTRILRDKDEIGLGERISKFMRRLGQGDRVFIILSDKYLKSPFCMNELSEVWRNSRQDEEEFLKRIRVYTMPDAKIWTLKNRLAYAVHWRQQYAEVEVLVKEHGNDILGDKGYQDYRRMKQFADNVTDILTTVTDILQPRSFEELVRYGFDEDLSKANGDSSHLPVITDFAVFRDIDAPWYPEMVALPTGEFQMGSPNEQERPQHRVMIGYRFAIGRHPVTFAEYDHFCDVTKRERPQDEGWGRGRRPVINVSWFDAQAYCEWLAKETGRLYRLPSEAEWEYACRAGTTTSYSWGDEITSEKANYGSKTIEVGLYPANAWGLCDMHGNVWEWVEDVWHESYYGAPTDGSAWTDGEGNESSPFHVIRGGSWDFDPGYLRSAIRLKYYPDYRIYHVGLRVSRTLD